MNNHNSTESQGRYIHIGTGRDDAKKRKTDKTDNDNPPNRPSAAKRVATTGPGSRQKCTTNASEF